MEASIWLTKDLPLKFQHLRPILEILGKVSGNMAKMKDFLSQPSDSTSEYFPIRAKIPIFLGVQARIIFKDFTFKTPSADLFKIPEEQQAEG